jgi:hypothetical protein
MPSPFQAFRGLSRPPKRRSAALCLALFTGLSAAQAPHHAPATPAPIGLSDQTSTLVLPAPSVTAAAPAEATAPSWTQANDTVGRFLRGHIDILRWEKDKAAKLPAPATAPLTTDTLSLDQALQLALRDRPQWLQRPNMSSAEQSRLRFDLQTQVLRVQRAWIQAVSAQQSVSHTRHALEAAEAGADLAERMAQIGNWSRARQMQEALLLWDARAQLQSAQLKALQTHLALWQLLAEPIDTAAAPTPDLSSNAVKPPSALTLPALPPLPPLPEATQSDGAALASRALAANAQWLSAQADALRLLQGQTPASLAQAQQTMAAALQATPAPRLQSDTPITPARLPAHTPWSHSTENAWQAKVQAEAMARQIHADVRLAHAAYLHAHTQATQNRVQVLHLHTALEQDSLLRYNGMLKSTWDLLASARQRIQSTNALHQAQTQAWLAWADLQAVLNGLPYTGNLNLEGGSSATASQTSAGH